MYRRERPLPQVDGLAQSTGIDLAVPVEKSIRTLIIA
jgi:hypothetical protein